MTTKTYHRIMDALNQRVLDGDVWDGAELEQINRIVRKAYALAFIQSFTRAASTLDRVETAIKRQVISGRYKRIK